MSSEKFSLRNDISWLNVWFSVGVITGLVVVGDLVNVIDLGLYPDDFINTIIGVVLK